MTMDEYADVLRTRPRMIGVRGAPEEGGRDVPLNLSDGTGLADARSNVIFAERQPLQLDGISPGGLGELQYNLATGSRLRLDLADAFPRSTNFLQVGWLDDETFQLAEFGSGEIPDQHMGALLVCHLSSSTCETVAPAPNARAVTRIVPNF